MERTEPTLADVKAAIETLSHEDRAMLRPWILARFDVRGYRSTGFVGSPRASDRGGAVRGAEESGG